MGASGSFSTSISGGHYRLRAVWSDTPNIANNTSTVAVNLYLDHDYSLYVGARDCNIVIDGTTYNFSSSAISSGGSGSVLLGSASKVVSHNGDGSKSISMSAYYPIKATISGTYYASMTASSGSVTLNTIPRASVISQFNNFVIGDTIHIVLDRKVDSFTHNLSLYVGNTKICDRSGFGASYDLVLTEAEKDIIYNAIPNAVSANVTLYVATMSGNTQIGSTQSKTAIASVGASIIPSFASISAVETVSAVSSIIGKFVQNLSKIQFTINGATGVKSSTIKDYKIELLGNIFTTNPVTIGLINANGDIVVTGTVTDSRGRSYSKTLTINLLPYSAPKITQFSFERCNADGTPNAVGTYVKFVTVGSVSSLMNGTEKNALTYSIYTKARGTVDWGTPKKTATIVGLSLNFSNVLSGYAADSAYDLRLDITDKFNTTLSLNILPTAKITMSWGKEGIGVGKIWERGALDVGGDAYVSGNFYTGNEQLLAIKKRLASGDDLNTCIIPGSYRLGGTHTNAPPEYPYGQLLVIYGGGDTIAQILFPYSSGNYYIRSGSPADVGGEGNWNAWHKLWNDGNDGAESGLNADKLDGHESSDFAKKAQEGWIAPTLINSWSNYDTVTCNPAGYFKDNFDFVHIRGRIKGGADGSTAFTLPYGYRPAKAINFACPSGGYTFTAISVQSDGNVLVYYSNTLSMPYYIDMGEIIFRI